MLVQSQTPSHLIHNNAQLQPKKNQTPAHRDCGVSVNSLQT